MTPVSASSHHSPAAEPCFCRRIAVAPVTPNVPVTPAITPNSPRRPPPQRPNRDRHRSVLRRKPPPAQPRPKPPPNQIPIDGNPPTSPRGFLPGGFRTPAAAPVDSSRPPGIRNPTPSATFGLTPRNGGSGSLSGRPHRIDRHFSGPGHPGQGGSTLGLAIARRHARR